MYTYDFDMIREIILLMENSREFQDVLDKVFYLYDGECVLTDCVIAHASHCAMNVLVDEWCEKESGCMNYAEMNHIHGE